MGSLHPAVRKKIQKAGFIPEELQAKYPRLHFCQDWDFMLLNDDDEEFTLCHCYYQDGKHWVIEDDHGKTELPEVQS